MHKKTSALESELASTVRGMDALGVSELPTLDIEVEPLDIPFPEFDPDAPCRRRRAPSSAPPPLAIAMPPGTGKTARTSIRIPRDLMEGFKRLAAADHTRYQTLMLRALREWLALAAAGRTAP